MENGLTQSSKIGPGIIFQTLQSKPSDGDQTHKSPPDRKLQVANFVQVN